MPSGTDYGLEESASSLSSSDEEVDLPKGVFIVEKIRAHRRLIFAQLSVSNSILVTMHEVCNLKKKKKKRMINKKNCLMQHLHILHNINKSLKIMKAFMRMKLSVAAFDDRFSLGDFSSN